MRTHLMPDAVSADSSTNGAPVVPMPAPTFALLRVTPSARRADGYALALTSRGISPVLHWAGDACELWVPYAHASTAAAELDAVDEEERRTQRARSADAAIPQRPVSKHGALGAGVLALLLLAFFAVTGPRADGSAWFAAGASDAERVLHGEWWRTITALTLHADSAHVISNVAIGSLAVGAVMRSEGVGWGAALVVASGAAGNLINAWAHQSLHSSVGFSTAVFGAIGLLGGLGYWSTRRRSSASRPAWTAIAGVIALLALLGTSEKKSVDLLAHLFGALAGVGLGVLTEWTGVRPRTPATQWLAGLGVTGAVVGAWCMAL